MTERTNRFEAMALPHLNSAFNLARWLVRDDSDAQDIVQDAYLRGLRYFDSFHGDDARPWLLGIVRNTCYTWLRARGQMPEMSVLLAIISVFISLFSFIHCTAHRTWIFFYLIVLVAVLWASFLLMQGAMIWVSALLFLIAGGTTIFSFLLIEPSNPEAA